jgi:hypothetical protein
MDTRAKAGKNPGVRSSGASSQPGPGLGKLATDSNCGMESKLVEHTPRTSRGWKQRATKDRVSLKKDKRWRFEILPQTM